MAVNGARYLCHSIPFHSISFSKVLVPSCEKEKKRRKGNRMFKKKGKKRKEKKKISTREPKRPLASPAITWKE